MIRRPPRSTPYTVRRQRQMCIRDRPIRGGTDGSQLSFMGLPTPNIFTGCGNFHGPFEYASIDVMEKAVQVVVGIAEEVAKKESN